MSVSSGAISADSAADVWAVGFLATSSTTSLNVSLHWNGISWTQNLVSHFRFGGVGPVSALSLSDVWPWAPARACRRRVLGAPKPR